MATSLSPSTKRRPRKGARLNTDNVFNFLVKLNKDWRYVGEEILVISRSKLDEISHQSPDDDNVSLRAAINFWLKCCVFASWRFIQFQIDYAGLDGENLPNYADSEPPLDSSITIANVSAALATLNDKDLADACSVPLHKREQFRNQSTSNKEYRRLLVEYFMFVHPIPSWEYLAGGCFYNEKYRVLNDVKEHVQRKLVIVIPQPSLTVDNLCDVLVDVKDWRTGGLPWKLDIPDSKIEELERSHPDLSQRKPAIIREFIDNHPAPSWERVCFALYSEEEYDILERVQNRYFKGTSEMRRHLQVAMKKGKGKTSITKVVVFGAAESGKTCTKHVVLDEEPPQEYTTTPLAVRPVTVYRIDITNPSQWKKLSRKERDLVIAKACQSCDISELMDTLQPSLLGSSVSPPGGQGSQGSNTATAQRGETKHASKPPSRKEATGSDEEISQAIALKSESEVAHLLETYDDLLSCMEECLTIEIDGIVFEIKRVQLADCGGQSQFHELLPIFIQGTTLYMFVFKLNEALSSYPMVRYSVDGKPICEPYACSETHEQILEHCLRVIRSQKATDKESKPHIMLIGTHKDEEEQCVTETRKDKNEKLAKLMLPEFKKEVKYYRQNPPELIFPLNAKNPGDEEKKIAAQIRQLVSEKCAAKPIDIPLQWHALESLLEDLSAKLGRDFVTKEELMDAAQSLHFEDESALDAALQFLHQHNLVFYYPDILPGLIFTNAQVLLNKVTEIVRQAHKLQDGKTTAETSEVQSETWQRFYQHALVSAELLAQKEFSQHYIPGVFDHKHIMKLFKELLIFAIFNSTEVFVPAILRKLTKEELDQHRQKYSASTASLVLGFPDHGGPLLGVFCATVVGLLSDKNVDPCPWKIDLDRVAPKCLYRNCVQFTIPNYTGTVMLIDSFQHIEVHISPAAARDDYPRTIKRAVIESIRRATLALHYDYSKPEIGISCPCNAEAGPNESKFHLATIVKPKSEWICSRSQEQYGKLSAERMEWLEDEQPNQASASDSGSAQNQVLDSMPKLHELDLVQRNDVTIRVIDVVAPNWERAATRLQFEGYRIVAIGKDHSQAESACRHMFIKWLEGVGREPRTWRTVVAILNEIGLRVAANALHKALTGTECSKRSHSQQRRKNCLVS